MSQTIIVAGIGTEIGKTVVSAILTKALKADYWKPIQSGDLDQGDAYWIQQWVKHPKLTIWPSTYRLSQPLSPHTAAELDGITIELNQFQKPESSNSLVIELAGGLMVPINDQQTNIDLIKSFNAPVILVSKNYLGSINHTLLSFELLKQKGIPVLGIVFNGPENTSGEKFILNYTQLPLLLRVNEEQSINEAAINHYAQQVHL
ncbi:dethiobiotin synthase [Aquirufa aurantiipilula]|uniref:ATP-dependent dethiobiotin synthetase BioD n=1 Tax=Aquirufa aurantiipilula TaxID=2696561 RepID=A0ABT6BGC3_9BACT|nr:dethiobiotin synthase [Aquirufa aurantiipilula]MDF5689491.1 dethiobiotin synthase [Aquirufa aurantiipilula]